jgi:hypothetical protein
MGGTVFHDVSRPKAAHVLGRPVARLETIAQLHVLLGDWKALSDELASVNGASG